MLWLSTLEVGDSILPGMNNAFHRHTLGWLFPLYQMRDHINFGKEIVDITCNNYISFRNAAQVTYAAAEKEYNGCVRNTLLGTSNSHKWWSTLKGIFFFMLLTVRSLPKSDGLFSYYPREDSPFCQCF